MTGPLKNSRHERFAQELAKGVTVDVAYRVAGFSANRGNASRMNANESIQARVTAIKAKAAERTVVTVASLTERLLKIADKAEAKDEAPMLSVARLAIMDAAKLNGFVVDKAERKLSDDQLAEVVRAAAAVPGGLETLHRHLDS